MTPQLIRVVGPRTPLASVAGDRRPRPALALSLLLAVLLALVLALPAPARAHDTLISTDPEDGASLETSPEELTLTFSGDLLDVSPVVRIITEDGTQLADITPQVEGPTATAALEDPLPRGTHTVAWRVVSGDGHPIEGSFTITVEQGEEAPAGKGAGGTAGTESSDSGDGNDGAAAGRDGDSADGAEAGGSGAEAEESTPGAGESADAGGLSAPVLGLILLVLVGGVIAAALGILRRRS